MADRQYLIGHETGVDAKEDLEIKTVTWCISFV